MSIGFPGEQGSTPNYDRSSKETEKSNSADTSEKVDSVAPVKEKKTTNKDQKISRSSIRSASDSANPEPSENFINQAVEKTTGVKNKSPAYETATFEEEENKESGKAQGLKKKIAYQAADFIDDSASSESTSSTDSLRVIPPPEDIIGNTSLEMAPLIPTEPRVFKSGREHLKDLKDLIDKTAINKMKGVERAFISEVEVELSNRSFTLVGDIQNDSVKNIKKVAIGGFKKIYLVAVPLKKEESLKEKRIILAQQIDDRVTTYEALSVYKELEVGLAVAEYLEKNPSAVGLVKVFGLSLEGGKLHSYNELMKGGELKDSMSLLDDLEKIQVLADAAGGIAILNELGYAHFDVASRNILIKLSLKDVTPEEAKGKKAFETIEDIVKKGEVIDDEKIKLLKENNHTIKIIDRSKPVQGKIADLGNCLKFGEVVNPDIMGTPPPDVASPEMYRCFLKMKNNDEKLRLEGIQELAALTNPRSDSFGFSLTIANAILRPTLNTDLRNPDSEYSKKNLETRKKWHLQLGINRAKNEIDNINKDIESNNYEGEILIEKKKRINTLEAYLKKQNPSAEFKESAADPADYEALEGKHPKLAELYRRGMSYDQSKAPTIAEMRDALLEIAKELGSQPT